MSRFASQICAGLLAIALLFGLVVFLVGPRANADSRAAALVLNEFYVRCRARNYDKARELFNAELQSQLSAAQLQKAWARFETKHGALQKWRAEGNGTFLGNRVNFVPRYVESTQILLGAKGSAGIASVQLLPQEKSWRLSRLSIVP